LGPVAATVAAEHGGQDRFSADVSACELSHQRLFSVRIEDPRVYRLPSDYLALTVPLDHELRFFDGHETSGFSPGRVHILWPCDQMDLHIPEASSLLVTTYPTSWLRECWRKGSALDADVTPVASDCLSLEVPEGRAYWRHLVFVWSEICNGAVFLQSRSATREIERTSAALLLLAFESGAICDAGDQKSEDPSRPLEICEAYIRSNLGEQISLADLVTVSDTSPSSLLRAFRIHRGTTPMKYVKQLRLESAQRALLAAKTGTVTVTDVAMEHGFFQLGRFSADYRRVFGELPSETLGH
jgi:AraC-like DNA-binding protein